MIQREVWEQFVRQVKSDNRFIFTETDKRIELFIKDPRTSTSMVTLMVKDMLGPEVNLEVPPGLRFTVHVYQPELR